MRAAGLLATLLMCGCAGHSAIAPTSPSNALPGSGDDTGQIVLYRDTWGVAHIYAPTVEDGLFAQGYAQAEDRPQQLLINLKTAMGELASVAGPEQVPIDLLSRMFDHYGNARTMWASTTGQPRARLQAFTDGINAFYRAHPEDLPQWWQHGEVTPAMVDAFARLFLYNWSIDEALEDLVRGGVQPTFAVTARGSNQWAVAPERSASGKPLLLIDPHLSWWGPSRFWEFRVHAGDWQGSGVGLAGSPYIGLGHNARLAWAMTTGGPDTADVYQLELHPDDPNQYRYDGDWRPLVRREALLDVRGIGQQTHVLEFSHHGPIIARTDGFAYAAKVPYDASTDRNRAWELLNFGENFEAVREAAATLAFFPQNIMAADTSGNIYYQRVGRVPRRAPQFDWSRPVDGSDPRSEWQGLHPSTDHLELLNPEAGYMQNCNIPPDAMVAGGAFDPADYPDYLFAGPGYGPARAGWNNLRGARALELLAADDRVTVDDALAYAVDVRPYGVDRWLAAFRSAAKGASKEERVLLRWDGELRRDSVGALRYALWRFALHDHPQGAAIRETVDDLTAIVAGRPPRPVALTDTQLGVLRATYGEAVARLQAEHGRTDVAYGEVFRVGRDDASWPVGGGGGDQWGLTTLRSMGYAEPNDAHQRWGNRGQTSTQLIHLSTPIESWMYLPVGNSDRPDSPSYNDQAAGPFSERRLKPSWWRPEDLAGNIRSRQILERR